MSFIKPGNPTIKRRSIAGMEGMYTKMWDPPTASPLTPDFISLDPLDQPQLGVFPNPVPEFMASVIPGFSVSDAHTVQRDLMHGQTITAWDGKILNFFMIRDADLGLGGFWPGPTIRCPRGHIFHSQTHGHGPPPHTIHWHGHEPSPMNDGVGHCSMEIGDYLYQWQPNFIGTYFHHCHRNTVQHFEFGLYGMTLIETPDAYNAAYPDIVNGVNIKNPAGYPRRTATNLIDFPEVWPALGIANATELESLGFIGGNLWDDDPQGIYPANPHAMTIPYNVEALWVTDDRDSIWSDKAPDARTFYPKSNKRPGVDDTFYHGFFHDFNADYWFVTGVPVPAHRGGSATIQPAAPAPPVGVGGGLPNGEIPNFLNSGVSGMQVAISAQRGDLILVRHLNGAYNDVATTYPVPVVIIAWDGRALGVKPFGFNKPYVVPAGTPIHQSVARRYDALIRIPPGSPAVHSTVKVEFFDTRLHFGDNAAPTLPGVNPRLMTAFIPIDVA